MTGNRGLYCHFFKYGLRHRGINWKTFHHLVVKPLISGIQCLEFAVGFAHRRVMKLIPVREEFP